MLSQEYHAHQTLGDCNKKLGGVKLTINIEINYLKFWSLKSDHWPITSFFYLAGESMKIIFFQ